MNPPGSGPRSSPDPPPDTLGPQRRERHALRLGLGVSLLLHLVLITLYGLVGGTSAVTPPTRPAPPSAEAPEPGMEVVTLAETESPEEPEEIEEPETPESPEPPEEPEQVENVPPPDASAAVATADTAATEETEERGEEVTLAERLQPRINDPRLWTPLTEDYGELDDEQRAQLLLRGMIQTWNDSVAIAAAVAEDARDWTYTDDEGRRWGIGPGGMLHLGEFAVPIPFSIGVPPGRREEWLEDQRIRDDLARGAATAAIRETWAERARAIRERLEAERDVFPTPPESPPSREGGDGGGDSP